MQIILLERIAKLGQMGDVVHVKHGFARNYLLPQGKALRATSANIARFETERAVLEAKNIENRAEAEAIHKKLEDTQFIIIRQSGDTGQLYGSVNSRDIAHIVSESGYQITRQQVTLDKPIKTLGLHDVHILLHPEVESKIVLNIARTNEEAERQTRGEDVTAIADDDDEREPPIATEEIFDEGVEITLEDDVHEASTGEDEAIPEPTIDKTTSTNHPTDNIEDGATSEEDDKK